MGGFTSLLAEARHQRWHLRKSDAYSAVPTYESLHTPVFIRNSIYVYKTEFTSRYALILWEVCYRPMYVSSGMRSETALYSR